MTAGPPGTGPQGEGAPHPHTSGPPLQPPPGAGGPRRGAGNRLLIGILGALAVALLIGALLVFLATRTAGDTGVPTVAVPATATARPRRRGAPMAR